MHIIYLMCERRNNLDICFRRISRGKLSTANQDTQEIVNRTIEIFENFHGPNLKREGVVKGLVGKITEGNPGYNKKIVIKIVRLNTFARSFRNIFKNSKL